MKNCVMGEVDVLPDADCLDCYDEIGPPPDDILSLPPPPLPYFIQLNPHNESSSMCNNQCIWAPQFQGVEFIELSHRASLQDGTWLLIIGAFCLGILLLAGLAIFLLLGFRSRTTGKSDVQVSATTTAASTAAPVTRPGKRCDSAFYPYPADPEGRVLWATLTPTGTTHHYMTPCSHSEGAQMLTGFCRPGFQPPVDNFESAVFVDSDSQTPLMESYQLSELVESDAASNSSTLRKVQRPRVSSPTRIENPNLPPLNLHPLRIVRRATLQRRDSDLQCSSPT